MSLRFDSLLKANARKIAVLASVTVFFAVVTVAYFFPVATHFETRSVGRSISDTTQVWWTYWSMAHTGQTPWTVSHIGIVGAPQGIPQPSAVALLSPIQPAFVWALKPLVGILGALNLFVFVGFVATGAVMFAFLWMRLGVPVEAAILGAYIVTFNPWMIERAIVGQIGFLHFWPLIGLAWVLLPREGDRVGWRRAGAVGAFVALSAYVGSYFGLLAGVLVVAWLVHRLIFARHELALVRRFAPVASFSALVLLLPALLSYELDPGAISSLYTNDRAQIDALSAKPWAYLVPSWRETWFHPHLWSRFNETQASENTLYFGYTTMALAIAAVIVYLVRRERQTDVRNVVTFAVTLAAVAFVASIPPDTHLLGIPVAGSALVVDVTSYFRVFARVGALVAFALAILASLALSWLVTAVGRRRVIASRCVAGAALLLVAADLLVWPVGSFQPVTLSAADRWLEDHPRGLTAFYPVIDPSGSNYDIWGAEYMAQMRLQEPIFNTLGANVQGTREELIRYGARDLRQPAAAGILRAEGVRYVVVDQAAYRKVGSTAPTGVLPGLRRVASLPGFEVYSPTSAPISPIRYLQDHQADMPEELGWTAPPVSLEGGFNGQKTAGNWMIQNGQVVVDNRSDYTKRFLVRLRAFSAIRPREVQLLLGKRILGRVSVGTADTSVVVGPIRIPAGRVTLTLVASPGPDILPNDGRRASVYVESITLEPLLDLQRTLN